VARWRLLGPEHLPTTSETSRTRTHRQFKSVLANIGRRHNVMTNHGSMQMKVGGVAAGLRQGAHTWRL
jgi:hypothetical protein